jgi:hypothetical protein
MSAIPPLRADERGWWLCDVCDQPINPKWKPNSGLPTPERPVSTTDGVKWIHRACEPAATWTVTA